MKKEVERWEWHHVDYQLGEINSKMAREEKACSGTTPDSQNEMVQVPVS